MNNGKETLESLHDLVARHKRNLAHEKKIIASLKRCIKSIQPQDGQISQNESLSDDGEDDGTDETHESEDLPTPMWDNMDNVYRCTQCCWEVVDGICEGCSKEFDFSEEVENGDEIFADSLDTNAAEDVDRTPIPRGTTPLPSFPVELPLRAYTYNEYRALRQRGATRLMIETFNLRFCHEGIFAHADAALLDEFSGPRMKLGDTWKIQLGRRFNLDPTDRDGSVFVEGLLEDALLFPSRPENGWETVEDDVGSWVTRLTTQPMIHSDDEEDHGGDDGDDDQDQDQDDEETQSKVDDPNDDGPVLLFPLYEDDVEMSEDSDVEMFSDGEAIRANVWDTPYDAEGEEDEDDAVAAEEDDRNPPPTGERDALEAIAGGSSVTQKSDQPDSDMDGSDFDSDEVLSGDESVLEYARKRLGGRAS